LDSDTEQNIQEALMTLSEGRTMLIIAHRLSTVTNADQILVLHAGKVAEAGTHEELLALKGRYANMWRKQIRAERAAVAASQMVKKANALQKAAMIRPGSSGNEGGGASEDVSENEADTRSSTTLASRAHAHDPEAMNDGDSSLQGSQADLMEFEGGDQYDGSQVDRKDYAHAEGDKVDEGKPDNTEPSERKKT